MIGGAPRPGEQIDGGAGGGAEARGDGRGWMSGERDKRGRRAWTGEAGEAGIDSVVKRETGRISGRALEVELCYTAWTCAERRILELSVAF
jgi:hypothetical protein